MDKNSCTFLSNVGSWWEVKLKRGDWGDHQRFLKTLVDISKNVHVSWHFLILKKIKLEVYCKKIISIEFPLIKIN